MAGDGRSLPNLEGMLRLYSLLNTALLSSGSLQIRSNFVLSVMVHFSPKCRAIRLELPHFANFPLKMFNWPISLES